MCCFSRPVKLVAKTKIFVGDQADGRQALVYAMDVELGEELAMVLPLPVPRGSAEDAVQFVSLEGYATFFDDMAAAFPDTFLAAQAKGFGLSRGAPVVRTLVVHDVGEFEASFVPTRADFARLDPRFQLPAEAWDQLPQYDDWGFAVFRLEPSKGWFGKTKRQSVHPMAFTFPRRDPHALFFPTVHIHDGHVAPKARFDHQLYAQASPLLDALVGWAPSNGPLGERVDVGRARGLVDPARSGRTTMLFGDLPNEDTWLRAPAGVRLDDLRGRGETWAFTVKAGWAFATGELADARHRAWHETASTRLPALCRALREGLPALLGEKRAAWRLAPLTDALAPHFMNGPHLWRGSSWLDQDGAGTPGGPGKVKVTAFTDRVEPQDITLGFAELPDDARLREIQQALCAILDAA